MFIVQLFNLQCNGLISPAVNDAIKATKYVTDVFFEQLFEKQLHTFETLYYNFDDTTHNLYNKTLSNMLNNYIDNIGDPFKCLQMNVSCDIVLSLIDIKWKSTSGDGYDLLINYRIIPKVPVNVVTLNDLVF